MNEITRFWSKVKKNNGCWEWQAKRNKLGYGQFWADTKKSELAHRTSWRLKYGPIPAGMLVCHHCDNRGCVRPDHLFLGTSLDNYHDCNRKGRRPSLIGQRNGNARLTDEQVRQMRMGYVRGKTRIADVAKEFGISTTQASHILSGRAHSNLIFAPSLGILSEGS